MSSSFRYSKVSTESSPDSPIEMPQPTHRQNRCCTAIEKLVFLRWPVTFFVLFTIVFCQLSILHGRLEGPEPGVEFNGLVPKCKLLQISLGMSHQVAVSHAYTVSTQKKVFRIDKRYRSDHRTLASINETKREWENLLPRKKPLSPPLHLHILTHTRWRRLHRHLRLQLPPTPTAHALPRSPRQTVLLNRRLPRAALPHAHGGRNGRSHHADPQQELCTRRK